MSMSRSYRVKDIESNLITAGFWPLDVLVIGSTGAGKSSTINALRFINHAKKERKTTRKTEGQIKDLRTMTDDLRKDLLFNQEKLDEMKEELAKEKVHRAIRLSLSMVWHTSQRVMCFVMKSKTALNWARLQPHT